MIWNLYCIVFFHWFSIQILLLRINIWNQVGCWRDFWCEKLVFEGENQYITLKLRNIKIVIF